MAENNSSAPLKTAEGAATLWCVHVTGADDVHPMPSREVALEEANALNASICRIKRQDIDPVLIAVVAEWPHSADSHAAGLMIRDECLRMRGDQALAAQAAPAAVVYAEARECSHCNHVGINDSADGVAACISCTWHGDSPKDDKCPECEAEGTMTASCPKCHHEYRLLADASIATPALPATEDSSAGDQLAALIEGMSVSVDVSTGDHDAGHRYFGTVTEVMEDAGDKHGVTLLVQDAKPNFEHPEAKVQAEPVAKVLGWVRKNNGEISSHFHTYESHCDRAVRDYGGEKIAVIAATAPQAQPDDELLLDYLEATGSTVEIIPGPTGWNFRVGGLHTTVRSNLRSSIDAAMAADKPRAPRPPADQGLPLLQEGQENGYGTCTIDAAMAAAQEGGKA